MEKIIKENLCKDCIIKSSNVFNLDEDEIELLCTNSTEIQFQKGERIIKQGTFTQNIVFVKTGLIKIHMAGPLHKDEILKINKGPLFVGVPDVFANKVHTYSVSALCDSTACFIDSKGYKSLLKSNGKFAYELIKTLSCDIVTHYQICVSKVQKQLTATFADVLLDFSNNIFENDKIQIPLTRAELGEYIGTSRETVIKIIGEFTKEKIIAVSGRKIHILNKDKLQAISKAG